MRPAWSRPGRTTLGRARVLILAVLIVILAGLTALRILPRLLSWAGRDTLESLTWSHRVLDRRDGELQIRPVNDEGLRRIFLPYEELPAELRRIVRISEDKRFYFHPGFDPLSLFRAAYRYVRDGAQGGGGSTISMQLARIINPRPSGVPLGAKRKARELWWALQIESRYSKREILELYMNLVPFGRNIEGFPAAARLFFGRRLSELTPGEMCILAVIPRSPAAYDPMTRPEANLPAAEALAEKAGLDNIGNSRGRLLESPAAWPFEAPHFVRRIVQDAEEWPEELRRGFEPIRTGLDPDMQSEARRMLKTTIGSARQFRIGNGAFILADIETMDVRVYLGSADFSDDSAGGQVDGLEMRREPGSTLKPLLYATLLDEGWTASTILPDIPTDFGGSSVYIPGNYNEQFHGPVRLRQALAASLNIPAVYALEQLGVDRFIDTLVDAGFAGLEDQRDGLGVSLAVGGGEVSPSELTAGFAALANGGEYRPLRFVLNQEPDTVRIWSAAASDIITDIISTPDDRVMTFGRRGPVRFDYPAAVKTGTSNQYNNIWAVGYTTDLVGGVWMGNFDGTTVMASPGSSLPAALLHEAFDAWSLKGEFPSHSLLETRTICSLSGMAATDHCPYQIEELYAPGTSPAPCDWHADALGRPLVKVRYPQDFSYWASRYGYSFEFSDTADLDILHPPEGAVFYLDPNTPSGSQSIKLRLVGSGTADLRVNGIMLGQVSLPTEVEWPLRAGSTTFTMERNGMIVRRHIEIR
ncbi:MAG: transglycosylase domain-containing protein [Spirochaetaceae bacterium]|nr:transglycosylase domain-containing protein [Spirochaetaceae bacterium]